MAKNDTIISLVLLAAVGYIILTDNPVKTALMNLIPAGTSSTSTTDTTTTTNQSNNKHRRRSGRHGRDHHHIEDCGY